MSGKNSPLLYQIFSDNYVRVPDRLTPLQEKMQEYLENGLRYCWLINYQDRLVEISRQNQPLEIVQLPTVLKGEEVLPIFELQIELYS